jgi:hypothetical protein
MAEIRLPAAHHPAGFSIRHRIFCAISHRLRPEKRSRFLRECGREEAVVVIRSDEMVKDFPENGIVAGQGIGGQHQLPAVCCT